MFVCLGLDVTGVWGRGDLSRSYVASHLGFLLTKGHHYSDHFPAPIYAPFVVRYVINFSIGHAALLSVISFLLQFSQESHMDPK